MRTIKSGHGTIFIARVLHLPYAVLVRILSFTSSYFNYSFSLHYLWDFTIKRQKLFYLYLLARVPYPGEKYLLKTDIIQT